MAGRGALLKKILNLNKTRDSGIEEGSSATNSFAESREIDVVRESQQFSDEGIIPDDSSSQASSSSLRARGRFSKIRSFYQEQNTSSSEESLPPATQTRFAGTAGAKVNVAVNYIRLLQDPGTGVFEYEVRFDPVVENKYFRYKLLMQHKNLLGDPSTFDGVTMYLPKKLAEETTRRVSVADDGDKYEVRIIFKREKQAKDCIHLYNVMFDRIAKVLKMVRYKRKHFDPTKSFQIQQEKLEIWPGHVCSVDEYDGGLLLCMDISFRVLNKCTVQEVLLECYHNSLRGSDRDFRKNFEVAILGKVVLTRYNNKTYRVDEVLWDETPMTTFTKSNGDQISFVDYYKKQYGLEIRDVKQPLLLNREMRRVSGKKEPEEVMSCLVPSLCHLTGLSDANRDNFSLMKEIASHTRLTPNQRIASMKRYISSIKESPEATALLAYWGLRIDESVLQLSARVIESQNVAFRNMTLNVQENGDFNRDVGRNQVMDAIDLTSWLIVYPRNASRTADMFVTVAKECSRPMGIQVQEPQRQPLKDDKLQSYTQALLAISPGNFQIVVILVPTQRTDRYSAIKRICCIENPIPSQVINVTTLSKDNKRRNVVQKVLLQMNCKMGGTLWEIPIPSKGLMVVGVDTYHDTVKRDNSVAAFVSSMDGSFCRWYSRSCIQKQKEELMNGLTQFLVSALEKYRSVNGCMPQRIIYYRDGVGNGQLPLVEQYEIPQLERGWGMAFPDYDPEFLFIVVQKRINTRIMLEVKPNEYSNPPPGTVLDHTITRKGMCDFYLVPQSSRQGTVSPTHYVIVKNNTAFMPDIIQKLTYRLSYLYYNWPGAVKVPAPCQYAHKLAFLVGEHLKRNSANVLEDKLFYL